LKRGGKKGRNPYNPLKIFLSGKQNRKRIVAAKKEDIEKIK